MSASWAANFDPSLTCANPKIRVAISDGYNRVTATPGRRSRREQKGPTAAIYTPPVGSTFRQYDVVPGARLRLGRGGRNDCRPRSSTGSSTRPGGFSRDRHGRERRLLAARGRLPARQLHADADGHGLDGNATDIATRTFTIVEDADNDGLPAAEDKVLRVRTVDPSARVTTWIR